MTKDEDDWLSDFLEAAQASARQSQTTAEKDYATRLKLLTPRLERASACDADEELAKRLAASEALAGQKKFDAAADALDEAFILAGSLLSTAAAAAVAAAVEEEPAAQELSESESVATDGSPLEEPVDETPAEVAPEIQDADFDALAEELPPAEEAAPEEPIEVVAAETEVAAVEESAVPADETAADSLPDDPNAGVDDALSQLVSSEDEPPAEEPGVPVSDGATFSMDSGAAEAEPPAGLEASAEDTAGATSDSAEEASSEEKVSPEAAADKSKKKKRP